MTLLSNGLRPVSYTHLDVYKRQELLNKTFSLIDEEQLLRVSRMLDKAKRVYIYGIGSSGLVAREMCIRDRWMADCSTIDEMLTADQIGFDYIGTTLVGYTLSLIHI